MPRLAEIILRARDSLADPLAERWTDARLIRLADDAQKTICATTQVNKHDALVTVIAGQSSYTLPVQVQTLLRAIDNTFQTKLPFMSMEQADIKHGLRWKTRIGARVQNIIYDKQSKNTFYLYPTPPLVPNPTLVGPTFGVLTGNTPAFGLVTAVSLNNTTVIPFGGSLQQLVPTTIGTLTISVTVEPTPLVLVTDLLTLPPTYDRCVTAYVVGQAFLDDLDTEHRALGQLRLAEFSSVLSVLTALDSHDSVLGVTDNFQPEYNGGI